jgi:hypothetical protein
MRWLLIGICLGIRSLWAEEVHFLPGDVIPLEVRVGGGMVSLAGSSDLCLVVQQECWMETQTPLFSWDGLHWVELEQFVQGEIHCLIEQSQAILSVDMTRR